MEKSRADKIITGYYKKLYGFALSKMTDIDKAEELASRITLEVYSSLLNADEIVNINGYMLPLHKTACKAKWTNGRMRMTVIEQLLKSGILTLPTEEQKATLTTVLFCDVLPEKN